MERGFSVPGRVRTTGPVDHGGERYDTNTWTLMQWPRIPRAFHLPGQFVVTFLRCHDGIGGCYPVYNIIHGVSDVEVIEKISSSPFHCFRPLKQNNPSDLQIIMALVVVAGPQFPARGCKVQCGLQWLVEKDAWAWYVVHCCQCVRHHYIVSLSASTLFFQVGLWGMRSSDTHAVFLSLSQVKLSHHTTSFAS